MFSTDPLTPTEWYRQHGCTHAHCPHDCEHPQPFMLDGKFVCGRCACINHLRVEMVPCQPDICS
jgi:hypothetical protein